MFTKKNLIISLGALFFITGCNNPKNLQITPQNNIINKESALQIRDIQLRVFDNTTKEDLVNAIVDTLLDDGYFITMIDTKAGVISAKNDKKDIELNLVSAIKEIKNDSYSVRFSINAVDKSLAFKSYIVINDEIIYRYLFDKLRKSLFLDKEFYNVPEKKELEKKEPTIKETEVKSTIEEKIEEKKPITKTHEDIKYLKNDSLIYSVQFLSTLNKKFAQEKFEKLKAQNHDVRIHPYNKYHVVRLGRFKSKTEAQNVMNSFKNEYPEAIIVGFKPKK